MGTRPQRILKGILNTGRVSNAYLLSGGDKETKIGAAWEFARSLNCTGSPAPCGECASCKKALKNVHPDIVIIGKEGGSIKIEQVRKLKEIARYGPSEGKWQVIIISDADALTTEASNSFLKILEEPAANVVFILIGEKKGALPQTVLSRCQTIIFEDPPVGAMTDEASNIYKMVDKKNFDYIDASQALSETKDARGLLEQLFVMFAKEKKTRQARAALETLKGVEKRANPKLAMDMLCLKLWKAN